MQALAIGGQEAVACVQIFYQYLAGKLPVVIFICVLSKNSYVDQPCENAMDLVPLFTNLHAIFVPCCYILEYFGS